MTNIEITNNYTKVIEKINDAIEIINSEKDSLEEGGFKYRIKLKQEIELQKTKLTLMELEEQTAIFGAKIKGTK